MLSVCIRSWPNDVAFNGYGRDMNEAETKFESGAVMNG